MPAQPEGPASSHGSGDPLPARAGRGGWRPPEAPEREAPVAQEGVEEGEVEAEVEIEPSAEGMEE